MHCRGGGGGSVGTTPIGGQLAKPRGGNLFHLAKMSSQDTQLNTSSCIFFFQISN